MNPPGGHRVSIKDPIVELYHVKYHTLLKHMRYPTKIANLERQERKILSDNGIDLPSEFIIRIVTTDSRSTAYHYRNKEALAKNECFHIMHSEDYNSYYILMALIRLTSTALAS